MVRFGRRYVRAWVVGILVACIAVLGVSAAKKSAKEKDGLLGPVRSVTEYYAECWEQSGQWVEGPRRKEHTVEYDGSGRMVEFVSYEDDGSVRSKLRWKYDAKGRLIEEGLQGASISIKSYEYSDEGSIIKALWQIKTPDSTLDSISLRGQHEYDNKGNLVGVSWYHSNGVLSSKETFNYDENGNQTEKVSYGRDGSPQSRTRYKYDAQGNTSQIEYAGYDDDGSVRIQWKQLCKYDVKGNIIELIEYGADGLLDYKETYKRDARGNEIELLHYDRDGSLTQEYTFDYIFDSHGNWIKRTRLMRITKASKSFWAPKDVRYRTITYY